MLNGLLALFSCACAHHSEWRVTHYNHSGAEQRSKRATPTQLDFALIIDEDISTLEVREGRANINNAKNTNQQVVAKYVFYIFSLHLSLLQLHL